MSRGKQTLAPIKDLSPLPDIDLHPAKRSRRGAADRSREKVRSFIRLLQRDSGSGQRGPSPYEKHQVERQAGGSVGSTSTRTRTDAFRREGKRRRQLPLSSWAEAATVDADRTPAAPQLVTITIHNDDQQQLPQQEHNDEELATASLSTPIVITTTATEDDQTAQRRRTHRRYVVVDYSQLHFGPTTELDGEQLQRQQQQLYISDHGQQNEVEEEERDSQKAHDTWKSQGKHPVAATGGGTRGRGRPRKVVAPTEPPNAAGVRDASTNEGRGAFVCRRCNVGHETIEAFLTHFESAHCPDLTDDEFQQRLYQTSFLCQRCDFYTADKEEMNQHELQHSQRPNPLLAKWRGRYHCDRCDFSASNAVTLSHHRKTHERPANEGRLKGSMGNSNSKTGGTGVVFACAECMTRFANRQDVLQHQQLVHGRSAL